MHTHLRDSYSNDRKILSEWSNTDGEGTAKKIVQNTLFHTSLLHVSSSYAIDQKSI